MLFEAEIIDSYSMYPILIIYDYMYIYMYDYIYTNIQNKPWLLEL